MEEESKKRVEAFKVLIGESKCFRALGLNLQNVQIGARHDGILAHSIEIVGDTGVGKRTKVVV